MLKRGTILILAVLLTAQAPIAKAQPASPAATVQTSGEVQSPLAGTASTPALQDIAQERLDRARENWWTLFFVGAAAVFTGLLFVTGAAQAALFIWQLRQIAEQGKLAREEFSATHRPRIRVRLLKVRPLELGKPVEIDYVVANVGENDAVKVRGEITLTVTVGPSRKEQSWTNEIQIPDIITGGCATPAHLTNAIVSPDWGDVLTKPNGEVRIQGTITYEEKSGIMRKTGFFRVCTDGLGRFSRFGSDDIQRDYEYED